MGHGPVKGSAVGDGRRRPRPRISGAWLHASVVARVGNGVAPKSASRYRRNGAFTRPRACGKRRLLERSTIRYKDFARTGGLR